MPFRRSHGIGSAATYIWNFRYNTCTEQRTALPIPSDFDGVLENI